MIPTPATRCVRARMRDQFRINREGEVVLTRPVEPYETRMIAEAFARARPTSSGGRMT